jgi:mono/diheme cytochrome c family protein
MTVQEVDQVVEYLESLQLTQMDAFAKVDPLVESALRRIDNAGPSIQTRLVVENAALADVVDGFDQYAVIAEFPTDVAALLGGAGTCTVESAALVGTTCSQEGADADRDGLVDEVEPMLEALALTAYDTVTTRVVDTTTLEVSQVHDDGFELTVSPTSAYSGTDASGNPVADLDAVEEFLSHLDAKHLELSLVADRNEQFAKPIVDGIAFLEASLQRKAWDVDLAQVAADTGLDETEATRAVGLFNAYCARCHTSGYSAGIEFEQEAGSGAWAPALSDGRTVVQFPDEQDHIDFVINGASASDEYGINGLSGVGGMPGFGALLSLEDIELIVKYERSL